MKIGRRSFSQIAFVSLSLLITGGVAHASHPIVRWDIVSVEFTTPPTITPGGISSALANDGSKVTLTGAGTFRLKPGNPHVTGGGTWTTFDPSGNVTGSGTYEVTGLVRFDAGPGDAPPQIDLIGNPAERSPGLAVLEIEYSDGNAGILVVSCNFLPPPAPLFEGVTATKNFVDFFNSVPPAPDVNANRTIFHISP
jgi:hypothetical protein